jgi:hypothetical protein
MFLICLIWLKEFGNEWFNAFRKLQPRHSLFPMKNRNRCCRVYEGWFVLLEEFE